MIAIVARGRAGPSYCETTNVGPPQPSGASGSITVTKAMNSRHFPETTETGRIATPANVHHCGDIVNRAPNERLSAGWLR
jgi:hypothetical protein